jgi:hypothetical protein
MLTAVVEIATLPVFHAGQYLPLRRAVALELIVAPGKFEVKRLGALEHSSDGMVVSSSGYSASNFMGSAHGARARR